MLAATKLGAAYRTDGATGTFRTRLAAAHQEWNRAAGQPATAAVPEPVRARLRTDLARTIFAEQHHRSPASGSELAGFVARVSRPRAVPVAGYDLTFTPVKSVSALWAVAPPAVAQAVEQAHRDACADTLGWLERQAAYTRLGRDGVRQVQVRGLLAVAFTHRDSRARDPNLHTHVAVSNKVQTLDGRWRALDGRPLHALGTAASERYNTRLEAFLVDRLGVQFADRPGTTGGKRAVREVVGVDPRLLELWSSRRVAIDSRRDELAARFSAEHGRPPTPIETIKLAQQATLETRQAKHQPRSHAEQRTSWRADAEHALGGPREVQAMLDALARSGSDRRLATAPVSAGWVADTAQSVLDIVQSSRATWREAHVRAEVERQARAARVPLGQIDDAVERVIAAVLSPALSVPLGPPDPDPSQVPAALRRSDGSSMQTVTGSRLFSSPQVLAAEQQLLQLAERTDGRTVRGDALDRAVHRAAKQGPGSLVLIDEAGMAGTLDLARAVTWFIGRGGSVRLVGDDAQLAAVGAGGVLRDLARVHGAAGLRDVARFTDPAEGPASLALRSGDPVALGFYLDRQRVHVADPGGALEQAYAAWTADRAAGLDSVLLAPTRDLARALNIRARDERLAGVTGQPAGPELALGDGTSASAGDRILTRRNDRRLVLGPTDWVRNGDRWTVRDVLPDGSLRAVHTSTRRSVLLPAGYVAEHVTLGYARTIHTAQGSTADTSHVVLTGREDRQLLYVALTRGRAGNHLYLQTAEPGDEPTPPGQDTLRPPTPAEALTRILARDGAQTSATSAQDALDDPASRLGEAAARYLDSLTVAAADSPGRHALHRLDLAAEAVLPGLTGSPSYPPLRAHLLLRAADGADPRALLQRAVAEHPPSNGHDPAADLHHVLERRPSHSAPLPWLPPVPARLAVDRAWGPHLHGQAEQIRDLARQVADRAATRTASTAPSWAAPITGTSAYVDVVGRLAVWRAARQVPDDDRRPLGTAGDHPAERRTQADLQADLHAAATTTLSAGSRVGTDWLRQLDALVPELRRDPNWRLLTRRLDDAAGAGHDVVPVLKEAVATRALPDELPAAALLWRLVPHLPSQTPTPQPERSWSTDRKPGPLPHSAPAEQVNSPRERWLPLVDAIDPRIGACTSWPGLAAAIERAHDAGYDVDERLPQLAEQAPLDERRPARALTYRLVEQCPAAALQLSAAARAADDQQRLDTLRQMPRGAARQPGTGVPAPGRGPAR